MAENFNWESWNQSVAQVVGGTYVNINSCLGGIVSLVNPVAGLTDNANTVNVLCGSRLIGGTYLYGNGEVSIWADKAVTFMDYNGLSNNYINTADNLQFVTNLANWMNN